MICINTKINTYEVNKTSQLFKELIEEFAGEIKQLSNVIEELKNYWEGNDADSFYNAMNNKEIPELNRLKEMLNKYAEYLEKVPDTYILFDEFYLNR